MRLYPVKTPKLIQKTFHSYTWKRNTTEDVIYLTFDDGPTEELSDRIADVLNTFGVPATFFCVGENLIKNPGKADRLLKEGHKLANHTYNHLNGWKHTVEDYLENTEKCREAMVSLGGDNQLFRPPYGRITQSQGRKLLEGGYEIVMWDVLSGDFDQQMDSKNSLRLCKENTERGSIVVFHDNIKAEDKIDTVLSPYIEGMLSAGFKFKTL